MLGEMEGAATRAGYLDSLCARSDKGGQFAAPVYMEVRSWAGKAVSPLYFGFKPSPDAVRANNLVGGHDARKR